MAQDCGAAALRGRGDVLQMCWCLYKRRQRLSDLLQTRWPGSVWGRCRSGNPWTETAAWTGRNRRAAVEGNVCRRSGIVLWCNSVTQQRRIYLSDGDQRTSRGRQRGAGEQLPHSLCKLNGRMEKMWGKNLQCENMSTETRSVFSPIVIKSVLWKKLKRCIGVKVKMSWKSKTYKYIITCLFRKLVVGLNILPNERTVSEMVQHFKAWNQLFCCFFLFCFFCQASGYFVSQNVIFLWRVFSDQSGNIRNKAAAK